MKKLSLIAFACFAAFLNSSSNAHNLQPQIASGCPPQITYEDMESLTDGEAKGAITYDNLKFSLNPGSRVKAKNYFRDDMYARKDFHVYVDSVKSVQTTAPHENLRCEYKIYWVHNDFDIFTEGDRTLSFYLLNYNKK